ncbi:MAG: FAD-dependent oxidoreductase [Nitrososphaerales archaeon]
MHDSLHDVIIIGAGAAGLAASIETAKKGARVLVAEQAHSWGGTAIISGGGCFVVDTPLQKSLGIKDSVDLAVKDWYHWSNGTADMEWARYYIGRSCPDLYSWAENLGVEWMDVVPQEGNSVPRWHRPKGHGKQVMTVLHKEAERLGVTFLYSSKAMRLIVGNDRKVVGCELSCDLEKKSFRSSAVIVATGGFCSNHEIVAALCPRLGRVRFLVAGGPGAMGSGHRLVEEAGGLTKYMDDVWAYPYGTPDPEAPDRGIVIRGLENSVWVNSQGNRFLNELLNGGVTGTRALLSQDPPFAWAIIDSSQIADLNVSHPRYRRDGAPNVNASKLLEVSPFIKKSATISDLGTLIGVKEEKLVRTIDAYNSFIKNGLDPEFGKPLEGRREIETTPFYAIQLFPTARKNLGGVQTDLKCRVFGPEGEVIPGLYAAGEVAGMAGGHINGNAALEGTMLGPSIISGRVAGSTAFG